MLLLLLDWLLRRSGHYEFALRLMYDGIRTILVHATRLSENRTLFGNLQAEYSNEVMVWVKVGFHFINGTRPR